MNIARVPLSLTAIEPRCSSDACPRTSQCARRMACVEMGSPMQDYTVLSSPWLAAMCSGFVDLCGLKPSVPVQPVRQAKPFPRGD